MPNAKQSRIPVTVLHDDVTGIPRSEIPKITVTVTMHERSPGRDDSLAQRQAAVRAEKELARVAKLVDQTLNGEAAAGRKKAAKARGGAL